MMLLFNELKALFVLCVCGGGGGFGERRADDVAVESAQGRVYPVWWGRGVQGSGIRVWVKPEP